MKVVLDAIVAFWAALVVLMMILASPVGNPRLKMDT